MHALGVQGVMDRLDDHVVRRQYLASARGDLEALRATLADDVQWTEMAGFPLAGTYRTPDGVTAAVMEPGKDIDVRVVHHFIVPGGRIVRFEQFVDTANRR
jgi:uncharacterized protein